MGTAWQYMWPLSGWFHLSLKYEEWGWECLDGQVDRDIWSSLHSLGLYHRWVLLSSLCTWGKPSSLTIVTGNKWHRRNLNRGTWLLTVLCVIIMTPMVYLGFLSSAFKLRTLRWWSSQCELSWWDIVELECFPGSSQTDAVTGLEHMKTWPCTIPFKGERRSPEPGSKVAPES